MLNASDWEILTNEACVYKIEDARRIQKQFEKQGIQEHIFCVTPEFIALETFLKNHIFTEESHNLALSLVYGLHAACC